jgi:hypothetical protein
MHSLSRQPYSLLPLLFSPFPLLFSPCPIPTTIIFGFCDMSDFQSLSDRSMPPSPWSHLCYRCQNLKVDYNVDSGLSHDAKLDVSIRTLSDGIDVSCELCSMLYQYFSPIARTAPSAMWPKLQNGLVTSFTCSVGELVLFSKEGTSVQT